MSLLVRHAMTEAPKAASPDMTAADAAGLMRSFDVGVVPVVDGDRLIGLVTDRDLVVRVLADRLDPTQVKLQEIATTSTVTISPDQQLSDARTLMAERQIRRLPVTKDGRLVGILSMGDLAVADASKRAMGEALEDVSASEATKRVNEGPESGTPERVQERREVT
ncbi:MAG TPA: CBS domain-containing protein [Actinomycetota bacterium]|nr:CBS domain-containing protein [Actinomycetota bacterium]